MEENVVFAVFVGLPPLAAWAVYLFFVKYRQHKNPARRWLRLIAGNLLVLFFLLTICVLFGEAYFRFWCDTTDSFGLTKTHLRWLERYYNPYINKYGARDNVDYSLQIPPGKRRVTFLGDSFTVGHGIKNLDDRFANLVRRRHPEWDVHVMGGLGFNTVQETGVLLNLEGVPSGAPQIDMDVSRRIILGKDALGRDILGRDRRGNVVLRDAQGTLLVEPDVNYLFAKFYQFDLVVLVFCLNDIADDVPEWPGVLKRIYRDSKPGWLGEHSYLFNTLHYRLYAARDPDLAKFCQFTLAAYDPAGKVWPVFKERLVSVQDVVRTGGGELLVVTFPYMDQLGKDYQFRAVHEQLDQFWKSLGVPHLDLLPVFERHLTERLVVNRFDAHPNERAQVIAADAINTFIERYQATESQKAAGSP